MTESIPTVRRTPEAVEAAIEAVRPLYEGTCRLCEWRCEVERLQGERGRCLLDAEAFVHRELLHFGEEFELIPSWTVYLTGCNLRCAFCMVGPILEEVERGTPLDPETLGRRGQERLDEGAINVNFLGGEPTVNLLPLLKALRHIPADLPLVLNTNWFYTEEVAELLVPLVDVYLGDFKFGSDACARRVAGVSGYRAAVERNLRASIEAEARVIARHLIMPGHDDCCLIPTLDWLAKHAPEVEVSLMDEFVPDWQVHAGKTPELTRTNPRGRYEEVANLARERGLTLVR